MKVGDFAQARIYKIGLAAASNGPAFGFSDGIEEVIGIIISIRDNPADINNKYILSLHGKPRKIVDIFANGQIFTCWQKHITISNEDW
tara:strand:+ start:3002 stop:3265 length:264 start_codon:yes stop_codon:yes gene_type:complete